MKIIFCKQIEQQIKTTGVISKAREQAALVVNLDPSFHLSMPFECYKKSGAHTELQLTLLLRNYREMDTRHNFT